MTDITVPGYALAEDEWRQTYLLGLPQQELEAEHSLWDLLRGEATATMVTDGNDDGVPTGAIVVYDNGHAFVLMPCQAPGLIEEEK